MDKKFTGEMKDLQIKAILGTQKRQPFMGAGAGIHKGEMYYGTNIFHGRNDKTAVLTSDRKLYVDWGENENDIRDIFELNYRFDFFGDLLDYDISYEAIKAFLDGKEKDLGLKACYEIILAKQKECVWHYAEGFHETIACSILSTYYIPVFAAKGRDFFNADMGFGKTQELAVYSGLAFHPLSSGNMSGASVYRVIESIKPTILIDDYDKIPEEQKQCFDQSLRVGYKRGLKAIRADDKRPMSFDLYSHMVINNIGGLDEVSESRCTKHNLLKCPEDFNPPAAQEEAPKWQKERDALYTCGLLHWKEVQAAYNTIKVPLRNRYLERDKATLTIASMVAKDVYDKVMAYIQATNTTREKKDLENDWAYQLLKHWKELPQPCWKKPAELAEEIASVCLTSEKPTSEKPNPYYKKDLKGLSWHVGKFLNKFPIIETKMASGYMTYYLTEENWLRIVKAKGLEIMFALADVSTLTTLTTPTPLSTTTTPENSQKSGVLGVLSGGKGANPVPQKQEESPKNEDKITINLKPGIKYPCCICGKQAGAQGYDGKLYCAEHYPSDYEPAHEDATMASSYEEPFKIALNWRPIGADG